MSLEGRADLVSRLMAPATRRVPLVIPLIDPFAKSPLTLNPKSLTLYSYLNPIQYSTKSPGPQVGPRVLRAIGWWMWLSRRGGLRFESFGVGCHQDECGGLP